MVEVNRGGAEFIVLSNAKGLSQLLIDDSISERENEWGDNEVLVKVGGESSTMLAKSHNRLEQFSTKGVEVEAFVDEAKGDEEGIAPTELGDLLSGEAFVGVSIAGEATDTETDGIELCIFNKISS